MARMGDESMTLRLPAAHPLIASSGSSDNNSEPEKTVSRIKRSSRKGAGQPTRMRMVRSVPSYTNMQTKIPPQNGHMHKVSSYNAEALGPNSQGSEFSDHAKTPGVNSLQLKEFKRRFSHDEFSGHAKNPGADSLRGHPHNVQVDDPVTGQVPGQSEKLKMLRRRRDKLTEKYSQLSSISLEGSSYSEGTSSSQEGGRAHIMNMTSIQQKQEHHHKKVIRFSLVEIREFPRILGDNPSCRSGPPITIGWDYDKAAIVKIPIREFDEISRKNKKKGGFRLVLSRHEREEILFRGGYTQSQIAQNVRQMIKIKNQRRQTINNLPVARFEEAMESVIRKIKALRFYRRKVKGKTLTPPVDIDYSNEDTISCLTLDVSRHKKRK
eukprot:scaffold296224_cov51-Attheya_sp.AAC.2